MLLRKDSKSIGCIIGILSIFIAASYLKHEYLLPDYCLYNYLKASGGQ